MNFLEALNPVTVYNGLLNFLQTGGHVLVAIMAVTFVLMALIVERYWYFWGSHPGVVKRAQTVWEDRSDHQSWYAHQIRRQIIGDVSISVERNLNMIKGLVGIAPLMGLLGTVTGMVEVFDVMAYTGSSNARLMAAGVSKATIPTMAGMVVSIVGLFFASMLERKAKREIQGVSDHLEIHH